MACVSKQPKMEKLLSKTTSTGEAAFPWKLHMVLDESIWEGFDDIISWQGNNAFKVHDPIQFERSIMQRFFNQTQYKSFQRQLNIYGFTRVKTGGKATGSYTHPLLVRGNPDACVFMIRTKIKKKGIKSKWNNAKMERKTLADESFRRYPSFDRNAMQSDERARVSPNQRNRSRSLSDAPTSCAENDHIEPTPIGIASFTDVRNTAMTNYAEPLFPDIVPCDRGNCNKINSDFQEQDSVQPLMALNLIRPLQMEKKKTMSLGEWLCAQRSTHEDYDGSNVGVGNSARPCVHTSSYQPEQHQQLCDRGNCNKINSDFQEQDSVQPLMALSNLIRPLQMEKKKTMSLGEWLCAQRSTREDYDGSNVGVGNSARPCVHTSSYQPEQHQRLYEQPSYSHYNNEELDLDTIFDSNNRENNLNHRLCTHPPPAVDTLVFDRDFQAMFGCLA